MEGSLAASASTLNGQNLSNAELTVTELHVGSEIVDGFQDANICTRLTISQQMARSSRLSHDGNLGQLMMYYT